MRRLVLKQRELPQAPAGTCESAVRCKLTRFQRYFAETLGAPDCSAGYAAWWVICEAIRIRPAAGPRRVESAFRKLLDRHEVLRLRYIRQGDDWIGEIQPAEHFTLRVEDHGDVDEDTLTQIVNRQANEPLPVDSEQLCDFRLLRFGAAGMVVLARVHHTLTDGYGIINIAEDFVKLILGLPMGGKAFSHTDYLRDIEGKRPDFAGEIEDYWRGLLMPPPAPLPLGRVGKGRAPLRKPSEGGLAKVFTMEIGEDRLKRATALATAGGGSLFSLISVGFADVLFDLSGGDDVLFYSLIARNTPALRTYAGCHVMFPTYRVRKADGDSLPHRAACLSGQIQASLDHISAEQMRPFAGLSDEIRAAGGHDFQFGVHFETADARTRGSLLSSLLRAPKGTDITIGPVSVGWMALRRDVTMMSELRMNFQPYTKGGAVRLFYDTESFEDGEIDDMARRLEDKLFAG